MIQPQSGFALVDSAVAASKRLGIIMTNEERLVRQARAGDEDAWRELIGRHQDSVFAVTFRLLGCRDDALEVSQETFLAAFRSINSFRGDSGFRTWLIKIAMRQAYRRAKYRPKWVSFDPEIAEKNSFHQQEYLKQTIEAAIMALPLPVRAVVILREFQGLGYSEIADALGIAIGTVESRLFRGRQQLRRLLSSALAGEADV
jgi:RNA polymerase sigma-70 factor (ECF subfamily)